MDSEEVVRLRLQIQADKAEAERIKAEEEQTKAEAERKKREAAAKRKADRIQAQKKKAIAEAKKEVEAAEKEAVKKRIPTYSQENVIATAAEMSAIIQDKTKWLNFSKEMGKVRDENDMWNRITQFWSICAETGEVPQKMDFYLFTGVDQARISDWRNGKGCSKEMQSMLQKFDMMYNSVRDTLADRNLINQIAYIWQSKQWQNYTEPVARYQVEQLTPLAELPSIESVEAKYLNAIPEGLIEEEEG